MMAPDQAASVILQTMSGTRQEGHLAKTVAVMQPYFFPYAGYFALMKAVDHFVIFDCVQFPRRGWVHRNKVPAPNGEGEEWITLPLATQPQNTNICDLAFAQKATATFAGRLARHSWLQRPSNEAGEKLRELVLAPLVTPVDFLATTIRACAEAFGVTCEISFSSDMKIAPELRGEQRVIAIARSVGGTRYVNLSGGRALYQPAVFRQHELELQFMPAYQGSFLSTLYRLCTEPASALVRELEHNSVPVD